MIFQFYPPKLDYTVFQINVNRFNLSGCWPARHWLRRQAMAGGELSIQILAFAFGGNPAFLSRDLRKS